MDDLATRLKTTSEECLKAYEAWIADNKKGANSSVLEDAVHELRKVSARLEIELSVSERDENGKALPLPTHRSQGHQGKGNNDKRQHNNNAKKPQNTRRPAKKTPPPSPSSDDALPSFISGDKE